MSSHKRRCLLGITSSGDRVSKKIIESLGNLKNFLKYQRISGNFGIPACRDLLEFLGILRNAKRDLWGKFPNIWLKEVKWRRNAVKLKEVPTSAVALHLLRIGCCSCNAGREGDDAIIAERKQLLLSHPVASLKLKATMKNCEGWNCIFGNFSFRIILLMWLGTFQLPLVVEGEVSLNNFSYDISFTRSDLICIII